VTGAVDDDPSSIATYSVVGAAYGYAPLWTALVTFPMMAAVQLMCARLGMVTGRGLAAAVRIYYPRWMLWGACSILVVANVINIGADLGGMAEATQLITGIRSLVWIPVYAIFIIGLLFWGSCNLIAKIFKWMTLVLFAYVLASFYAPVDWRHALAVTFVPHLEWSRIPGGACRNSGGHDFTLSFLLAGSRGGGGGTGKGSRALRAQGRDRR
jgi:Mn2+/Fe2+ NRAMP family transporter